MPFPKPLDTTGQKLNVTQCAACDGPHESLDVQSFKRLTPPWTHWFMCPSTNDPVPLCLVMKDAEQGIEVSSTIVSKLIQAQVTGSYLVAIVRRNDDKLQLDRVTHNFPTNDFAGAVKLLDDDLTKEVGPPEAGTMQQARPAPLVNLFQQNPLS